MTDWRAPQHGNLGHRHGTPDLDEGHAGGTPARRGQRARNQRDACAHRDQAENGQQVARLVGDGRADAGGAAGGDDAVVGRRRHVALRQHEIVIAEIRQRRALASG